MASLFLRIYDWLAPRRRVRLLLLAVCLLLFAGLALRLDFDEDISVFFPSRVANASMTKEVFATIAKRDRLTLMLGSKEGADLDPDTLVAVCDALVAQVKRQAGDLLDTTSAGDVQGAIPGLMDYISHHLADYATPKGLALLERVGENSQAADSVLAHQAKMLQSPVGLAFQRSLPSDPLGLGRPALAAMQQLDIGTEYALYANHLFSADLATLVYFFVPLNSLGNTRQNDRLVHVLEESVAQAERLHSGLDIKYFGGSAVAVYNARQIKHDTLVTVLAAVVLILLFAYLSLRKLIVVPLIAAPVLFGGLFALGVMGIMCHSVSAIAIGCGVAVLGISISYAVHVLIHFNDCGSARHTVEALAYPLSVGSFTTIGAFLGLLFTSSGVLQDFGLFSALSLIGTTLFCLVFLPHLLPDRPFTGQGNMVYRAIVRINSFAFDRSKGLIIGLLAVLVASIPLARRVGFDSDMGKLNYMPQHLASGEQALQALVGGMGRVVPFVVAAEDGDLARVRYQHLHEILDSMQQAGRIEGFSSAASLLPTQAQLNARREAWARLCQQGRGRQIGLRIEEAAKRQGFARGAFSQFTEQLTERCDTGRLEIPYWQERSAHYHLCIAYVTLGDDDRDAVYQALGEMEGVVIVDREYVNRAWVGVLSNDFYTVLGISSLLIFIAFLFSYGRIETTLITFTPMAVSWVIIVGLMGLIGLNLNIVNIILENFIFGLGYDFIIFVMDVLGQRYRYGRELLTSNRVAIFFSAFTAVVGLGVLFLAKHPAMRQLSSLSFLGMAVVVLVAFTLPPILFRVLVDRQVARKRPPLTLFGMLGTLYCYAFFCGGMLVLLLWACVLRILPLRPLVRRRAFTNAVHNASRVFRRYFFMRPTYLEYEIPVDFSKPCIVVANHQSMLDLLMLYAIVPHAVVMSKEWVWHSRAFGWLLRMGGFLRAERGQAQMVADMRIRLAEGLSLIVFPEGTRSKTGAIGRFHNGAFAMARELGVGVVPVVIYGLHDLLPKGESINLLPGEAYINVLRPIPPEELAQDASVKETTRRVVALMRSEQAVQVERYRRGNNPFIRREVLGCYTYKGPEAEWGARRELLAAKGYGWLHSMLPRNGRVVYLGSGWGTGPFMLQRLAPERQILGVEQSADKCLLCQHCYLAGDSVSFTCANPIRGNIGMECRAIVVSPSLYPELRGEPTWLEGMLKSNPEGVELLFPPAKGNVKLMFTVGGREVAIPSTGAVIQMQAQSLEVREGV